MILSDDQDLWLENAYQVMQCTCDTNFDELIGEAGLFHIKQSQDMSGWLAALACHCCPLEIEKQSS